MLLISGKTKKVTQITKIFRHYMLVGCKALSNSDFPIQKVRWLIAASLSTSGQEILYAINKSSVLEHKIILYW